MSESGSRLATLAESGPSGTLLRAGTRARLWAAFCVLIFLALSVGYSVTRPPWWDEGVFADIALNFRDHGHLGNSTLYSYGYLEWPEANHYTYWQFPFYLITLGSWLHLVPPTIEWIRMLSVLWACLYVFAWFLVVRALSRDEPLSLLVASMVALDYATVAAASNGRMDMMCAALGQAALAVYLWLRDSHWNAAVTAAGFLGAASLLCHPMGVVTNAFLVSVVLLDWKRIRWTGILGAAVPYLIGSALLLRYILQAPAVFLAQTKAASTYRITGFTAVIENLFNDLYLRYGGLYYSSMHGINKLKVASLIFAVVGVVAFAMRRNLRHQPLGKMLLFMACIAYIGVALVDNQKFPIYFIYSMPVFTACGVVWVHDCWKNRGPWRWISAALLGSAVAATIAGFTYKIHENDYDHLYKPAVAAIRASLPPGGLVMGGSELGFGLGFGSNLIDDRYLGFFSGKTPDVFVVNQYYGAMPGAQLGQAWVASREKLRTQYHLTFSNEAYRVYALNRGPAPQNR